MKKKNFVVFNFERRKPGNFYYFDIKIHLNETYFEFKEIKINLTTHLLDIRKMTMYREISI